MNELNRQKTEGENHIRKHVSQDVLDLLCAQGDLFVDGVQIILKPEYFSLVMKPLIDHKMTKVTPLAG